MKTRTFYLILALIYVSFLSFLIWWEVTQMETVTVNAKVINHAVVADKSTHHGVYLTIIKRNDGVIQELKGLKYYVIPEGSEISIQVRRQKN